MSELLEPLCWTDWSTPSYEVPGETELSRHFLIGVFIDMQSKVLNLLFCSTKLHDLIFLIKLFIFHPV